MPRWPGTTEERFWEKVNKDGPRPICNPYLGKCWLWIPSASSTGYGNFCNIGAHRFAYELLIGPISPGMTLDHLCLTKHCVNPWHLEQVTQKVNSKRYFDAIIYCIHGHELSGGNVYVDKNGYRVCRSCSRDRTRKYRVRMQEQLAAS